MEVDGDLVVSGMGWDNKREARDILRTGPDTHVRIGEVNLRDEYWPKGWVCLEDVPEEARKCPVELHSLRWSLPLDRRVQPDPCSVIDEAGVDVILGYEAREADPEGRDVADDGTWEDNSVPHGNFSTSSTRTKSASQRAEPQQPYRRSRPRSASMRAAAVETDEMLQRM